MAKTYDEKRRDFQRMLEGRLPKAVKAIELLSNLARKSDYAWLSSELQSMIDQIDDAVDGVMDAFGLGEEPARPATDGPDTTQRSEPETVGSSLTAVSQDHRAEVRWAYDALRRGDLELAEARMKLVIADWIEGDRGR